MAKLDDKPTLADLQIYMKEICAERGWDQNNHLEIFLLFSEEIGELAKAIRNHMNLYNEEKNSKPAFELEEEFADVLSYLLDLANHFNVDLEKAFREKEKVNSKRVWK